MTKMEAQQIFNEILDLYETHLSDFDRSRICPTLAFNRSVKALGTCKTTVFRGLIKRCEIFLSIYAMEDVESVRNTLAHEIAHTFNGCQNHGEKFKAVGKRFEKHTGIVINTRAAEEESNSSGIVEAEKAHAKYIVKCENCGYEWYYQRNCKVVQNYQLCSCTTCGKIAGKLKLIVR